MRRWIEQSPVTTGVVLVVAGFIVLFLGWNGAAGLDYVEGQIPYLISAGFVGMSLIGAGLAVSVVQSVRRDNAAVLERLDELVAAARDASGGGTVLSTVGDDGERVLAGRATYHRPTCRLAQGRAGLQPTTAAAASGRGLNACRVCKPGTAAA